MKKNANVDEVEENFIALFFLMHEVVVHEISGRSMQLLISRVWRQKRRTLARPLAQGLACTRVIYRKRASL